MTKVLGVLVAVLGGCLIVGSAYVAAMRRQVDDLKSRLERLESRQRDAVAKADVEKLEEQVSRVESEVASVRRAPAASVPDRTPAGRSDEAPRFSVEQIDDIIDKKVEEKVKARVGEDNGFGGKKRPLADVAKEMGVPADAELKMADAANKAKQEVFDLLKLPRAEGGNLVDDIIDAMTSGDQVKAQQQFMRIFKENVPGTNETYFTAALRISEEATKKFEGFLSEEQMTKYRHTGVGPLDLETGFDPWAAYMKSRGQ